jgi:hypothetical protein
MAQDDIYSLYEYEPLQVTPCTGISAVYRQGEEIVAGPIVAMAVCKAKEKIYSKSDGFLHDGVQVATKICGVAAGSVFTICEADPDLIGYLAPDEKLEDKYGS